MSNNSPKASAEAPKTAASGKHMVVEFVSTFVDANDAVKYAEVKQTDGKTGYLWVTTSFWNGVSTYDKACTGWCCYSGA